MDIRHYRSFILSFHAEISKKPVPGVEVVPFAQDVLVAICAATLPLAQCKAVTLEMLSHWPFVDLTPERALRRLIDKSLADHGLLRKSMCEVSAVETMMQFVAGGLGVSIVPAALAKACAPALRLHILPFNDQSFRMIVGVAFAFAARAVFLRLKIEPYVGPLRLVYLCVAVAVSCLTWLLVFKEWCRPGVADPIHAQGG